MMKITMTLKTLLFYVGLVIYLIIEKEGDVVPNNLPPAGNPYGRTGKKPPIKCIEDGCENWQHGKSLCKKHYL